MADSNVKPKKPLVVLTIVLLPLMIWFGIDRWGLDSSKRPIVVTGTVQAREIPLASKVGGRLSKFMFSRAIVSKPDRQLLSSSCPNLRQSELKWRQW